MARTLTFAQLRADIRVLADIVNSTHISEAMLGELTNQAIAAFTRKLARQGGQRFSLASTTYSLTAGVELYALPSDFWMITRVRLLYLGQWIELSPYVEVEYSGIQYLQTYRGIPGRYRLVNDQFSFIPIANATYQVEVHYVPTPAKLVNDGDLFDGIAGWEDWVKWQVAAWIKGIREEDPSFAMSQLARIDEDIEALGPQRDAGMPEKVADVYGRTERLGDDMVIPRIGGWPWP